jgi:hypothetical protein
VLYLLLLLASTGHLNQVTDFVGRIFTFHHDQEGLLQRFQGHHPEQLQEQLVFVRYQCALIVETMIH